MRILLGYESGSVSVSRSDLSGAIGSSHASLVGKLFLFEGSGFVVS